MNRVQDAVKDEKADGQENRPLDDPAVQALLPASRRIVSIASKISRREIFERPLTRSVKVIGTSTMLKPARSQRVSSSTSAE